MENSDDVKDAVSSAVQKEQQEGQYLLSRFREQLEEFESDYEMDTETFMEAFKNGRLGDKQDFFEWKSIHKSVKYWEEKLQKLEKAS